MSGIAAVLLSLLVLSVFSPDAAAQTVLTPQQKELFLSSSVKLRVDADNVHSWGTGTIIDTRNGEALILTCGHIFRERIEQNNNAVSNVPVEVHLYGGRTSAKVDGYCLFCNLETDIALIAAKPPFPVQGAALAPQGYVFQSGQTVWSSGCGGGANPSLEQHQIMSLDKISPVPNGNDKRNIPFNYIQVSGAPVSGRSGGGLFTADNYLIGVCNTGDPQNNDGQFVPAEVIRQILQSMKLETVYEHPSLRSNTVVQNTVPFEPSAVPAAVFPPISANSATLLPLRPIDGAEENRNEVSLVNTARQPSDMNSNMNNVEQATMEEIKRRAQDGDEVILIIRSRRNPEIPSDVIVLNGTSDQFLNQLTQGVTKVPQETANYAEKYEPAILTSALTPPVESPQPQTLVPPAAQVYTGNTAQTGQQTVSFPVLHR
ncbi:hypothetical protein FACS18942_06210 [Planctomycetales bacterium]|nr:hypothetical protein FACS18942_06210 [Planctomycetales bacterium]